MSRVLFFIVGTYSGLYVAQNYEVPKLPGPIGLIEYIKEMAQKFEKKDK